MNLNAPVISATATGVLIILQMGLMLSVALARRANRQSLGDGGKPAVLAASRRHGNFAENAAIFAVALALMEMIGAPRLFLEICAAVFVAGRISHVIGLSLKNTVNPWRVLGVAATVGVGLVLGVHLVLFGLHHLRF